MKEYIISEEISLRREAVSGGRCMVRVRRKRTGEKLTAGLCPGCWNMPAERERLLDQLSGLGMEVISRRDLAGGDYAYGMRHVSGCPRRP